MSKKIRVLITGAGGGNVGIQVMDALKLAKNSYYIVTTNVEAQKTGLYEGDIGYLVPPASHIDYIPKLLKIAKKEGIQVIISGSEPEMMVMSKNRTAFEKKDILVLINSEIVIDTCQDKYQTMQFLEENKFLYPKFTVLKKNTLPLGFSFPVVVKPSKGGGGSKNVFIARNTKELIFYRQLFAQQNLIMLIQEYIGTADEEYTVGVLTDFKGNLIESIALKRIVSGTLSKLIELKDLPPRQNQSLVLSSGISQGFVDDYYDVRKYCEKIAQQLHSTGPLNIQCRKTKQGIYTMEINPRFSGTTSIRALLGFNEPDILIRKNLLGEKINQVKYKKGLVLREFRMKYIDFNQLKKINKQKYLIN
ncbi:MAG: ATP-grasp domain protein [Berkelbacteria bacterium GW2011_GWA1_36_9]|uniref:ATP-grasp domain protein n=1 Tax=Berkelbacteria bacterium GW2011_GWA1_36_9 TaxID=1618331 RepID=A0A0G0I3B5_9BACT|nr:MAG: ATP-grasp domain protein [Berkelbacteria bacterium GW2011_GWA1_36_9]